MLTYTWAQPKPTWPQLESNMAQLGHVLTWLGPNMTQLRPVKGNWTPTQAQRGEHGPVWASFKAMGNWHGAGFQDFGHVPPMSFWPQVGQSCPHPTWAQVVPCWSVEPADVGFREWIWDNFCVSIWNDMKTCKSLVHFLALCRSGKWSELKLHQRFADSFCLTLNYHVPAPSARADL